MEKLVLIIAGCIWGTYGYNCNETCQAVCENNGTCSATTGICQQVNQYIYILKEQVLVNYFQLKNISLKKYVNQFITNFPHRMNFRHLVSRMITERSGKVTE